MIENQSCICLLAVEVFGTFQKEKSVQFLYLLNILFKSECMLTCFTVLCMQLAWCFVSSGVIFNHIIKY